MSQRIVPGPSTDRSTLPRYATGHLRCSAVELDIATAPTFAAAVLSLVQQHNDVVVDLAGVQFIDASGIRVFAGAVSTGDHGRRRFVVHNARPQVRRVFAIAQLCHLLDRAACDGEPTGTGTQLERTTA